MVRHGRQVHRDAHHLPRHRDVELDLGPGGGPVFLAPLLFAPARPQLRQPEGAGGGAARHALLARHGRRRAAARRHPLPDRARRHLQREPARDPRDPEEDPRGPRRHLPGPHAAGRGQHVARGHADVFRRRRRMPHGVPLPADAAHVHGDREGGPLPDHRHHAPDAGDPAERAMGDLPAQPRRADARDGDGRGARLPVEHLRVRQAGAHQPRHPPAAGAAAAARPAPHRADERPAPVHARHARDLLRRRDRHGRQHPPRRPRRRAHADAVDGGPQRRLLARRPGQRRAAAHHGPALRLQRRERGGPGARPAFAAELDAAHAVAARQPPGLRPRHAALPLPRQPARAGLPARVRGRHDPVRRQPVAHPAGGGAGPRRVRGPRAGRAQRPHALPAGRQAELPAHPAALRLLLAGPERDREGAVLAPRRRRAAARVQHLRGARKPARAAERALHRARS